MGNVKSTACMKEPELHYRDWMGDETHVREFKMHRTVCLEELPSSAEARSHTKIIRSRQPASKTFCAFLNSNRGGRLYAGVSDDGAVLGFPLTADQVDHYILSVHDTLSRFKPPVPKTRYSVRVEEVVFSPDEEVVLINLESGRQVQCMRSLAAKRSASKLHTLRSTRCWCEENAQRLYKLIASDIRESFVLKRYVFVVDFTIWTPNANKDLTKAENIFYYLPPIYQNEEGLVYTRRSGSNGMANINCICDWTRDDVSRIYKQEILRLQQRTEAQLTAFVPLFAFYSFLTWPLRIIFG